MEYQDITKSMIEDAMKDVFLNRLTDESGRRIRMYTGIAGFDLYQAIIENKLGFTRTYIGKKNFRFPKSMKVVTRKSVLGMYYKLVKIKNFKQDENISNNSSS